MEFHYYYIIQDIVGVLMAFIGIRMFTLSIRMILSSKKSKNGILISISYALITIAAINLLFNNFGLKPWIVSIILILLSLLITNIVKTDKTI
ncbi:hypothetical protein [Paraclostridium bifermentans]|uniref:hypothetical protein n=1 Tax=Paraclostridium bifermentans TaxID=1490 RepID=UPI00038D544B|nr:hypothetical protein [Paraclostridium bifermentans]EQK44890.1 putative membrane protein [[Clostridium] bifermentans ATCC 19299] [Paraclostridium bifermentans ATCC 19299]